MKKLSYSYLDIILLALPLMVSNFFYTLISFADVVFMKELGLAEQGAISFVALLYLIFFMISFSYTKGTQIFIARKDGEDKKSHIGIITDNTIAVLGIVGLVIFLVFHFYGLAILSFFLEDKIVLNAAMDYLVVRKYAFLYGFLGSVLIAYYSGISRVAVLAFAIIIMSIANISLNWVLIFGKFGFPELGIKGAAWASNIAEALSVFIMLAGIYFNKYHKLHLMFSFKLIKWEYIKRISQISAPLVLLSLIGLVAWLVFFSLIEKMGVEELAISSDIKQIYTVLGIPAFALATATNTIIGNVIGKRKFDEIIPLTARMIIISVGFIGIFVGIAKIFPLQILSLIMEDSIIEASLPIFDIALIALVLYAVANVIFNTVVTLGSNRISLAIEIIVITAYIGFLYYAFFIVKNDLALAWKSEWIYWASVTILSLLYLRFGNWKEKLKRSI
ncbi:MAG: MATE family efflux transporter [Chitinophagales bacterium]